MPVYKHYMYINTVYKMFANKNTVINLQPTTEYLIEHLIHWLSYLIWYFFLTLLFAFGPCCLRRYFFFLKWGISDLIIYIMSSSSIYQFQVYSIIVQCLYILPKLITTITLVNIHHQIELYIFFVMRNFKIHSFSHFEKCKTVLLATVIVHR